MSDTDAEQQEIGEGDVAQVPALVGSRGVEVVDPVTGEIVPAGESGLAFADVLDNAAIAEYVADMGRTNDESPENVQIEIAKRILEAPDAASVWAATQVLTARELLNTPIVVEKVRWVTSAHKAGPPKFAVIEGRRKFGDEAFTMTCGAMNVVLTLYKLQKFGALPADVVIKSKPSGSDAGRTVLTIEPAA